MFLVLNTPFGRHWKNNIQVKNQSILQYIRYLFNQCISCIILYIFMLYTYTNIYLYYKERLFVCVWVISVTSELILKKGWKMQVTISAARYATFYAGTTNHKRMMEHYAFWNCDFRELLGLEIFNLVWW